MAFEIFKKLMRLLDQVDEVPDAKYLQGLKSQFQTLEHRLNLLEAYLQAPEGRAAPKVQEEQQKELRGALDQLSGAVQSTVQLLQRIQEGQRRNDDSLKSVQERLQLLERTVQSLSLKSA